MSAALQLTSVWGTSSAALSPEEQARSLRANNEIEKRKAAQELEDAPPVSLAFYRKHTESMLRRYLYASMQVGRAPSVLENPVARGWASSRPVRTFEDAVIFVLDVERCLEKLQQLDRQLLCRIVLQEYTQAETAVMLGMGERTVTYKYPQALDRLTDQLLKAGLLILPQ